MALKQLVIPLDENEGGLSALRFVLKYFGSESNVVNILWLGARCTHPEKAVDVHLPYAMAKLGILPSGYGKMLRDVLEKEFHEIRTNINVITLDHFTRKQLSSYCSFSDSMISTFGVYQKHLYPLFKNYSTGRGYAKVCCPKILISEKFDHAENIVLVKTDQVNTIATVKQFCHVYSDKCSGVSLNLLDLQELKERGGFVNSQKMLVDYLKQHTERPAIYPYSGEDPEHLAAILNLNKNTLWVSPLESVEELKFMTQNVLLN
tara:strand:- start:43960 stop:44745 length:786 start_codon:yes stop_codon:yes gene_type:complete